MPFVSIQKPKKIASSPRENCNEQRTYCLGECFLVVGWKKAEEQGLESFQRSCTFASGTRSCCTKAGAEEDGNGWWKPVLVSATSWLNEI